MKKLLSILLVLGMLLSLAPLALASGEAVIDEPEVIAGEPTVEEVEEETIEEPVIEAEEAPALDGETHSGTCGTNLTWSLDTSTGVMTISGAGYMDGYESYKDVPWYPYADSINSAVIKDGVKSVGDLAFIFCENMTIVTLGNSVETIGDDAFSWCDLESIEIPDSVVTIGDYAFDGNKHLTSVTLGNSLKTIGESAFCDCDLHSLTLPNSITTIGEAAFWGNESLKKVTRPKHYIDIGEKAFGWTTKDTYDNDEDVQFEVTFIYAESPFSGDIALTGLTLPEAGAEAKADAKAGGSGYGIAEQGWYGNMMGTQKLESFEAGGLCIYACKLQPTDDAVFERDGKYAGTITLNGETLANKSLNTLKNEYLDGKNPVKGYYFRNDTTLMIMYICELSDAPAEPPTLTFAADAKSVKASGDFSGLYARVALVIDNNGVSGLYITQATINADGTILIPEFKVPGLTVKGVNVSLVPTLADIQSTTPNVKATASKML